MPRPDLSNKYRPTKLDDVIGQESVVKSLAGVLERKSSHSFVLTGPSGVGKTTIARIAADMLGCDAANLQEIDAATHSGAEAWRDIMSNLPFAPLGRTSKVKVVIVDEAHGLSKAAWNSMLKMVEEPPLHVFIFFCTTEAGKIPRTILTRCARYDLRPIHREDINELLIAVCVAEDGGPPAKVLGMISRNCGGSAREALTALAACWDAKDPDEAEELLQAAGEDATVVDLCRALVKGTTWSEAVAIVRALGPETNAESVRHQIQAYMTKAVLGAKTEDHAARALTILEPFVVPYPPGATAAPLLMSLGDLLLGRKD